MLQVNEKMTHYNTIKNIYKYCCDNYKYDSRSLYADIELEQELHLKQQNPLLIIFVLAFFAFGGCITM